MTDDDRARIEQAIRDWHERSRDAQAKLDELEAVTGCNPDSPLNAVTWALIGGWLTTLDHAYSIGAWLDWWWHECRLGEYPTEASIGDAPLRKIATVDDLVALVLEDLARG